MALPQESESLAFGMLIDGTPRGIGFPTLQEAEIAGAGLAARGQNVQIFDKVTKQIVKTFWRGT